jgi:hypothetical protein
LREKQRRGDRVEIGLHVRGEKLLEKLQLLLSWVMAVLAPKSGRF